MAEIDAQALARDADLAEIARIYVPDLAKKGREWAGRCPFHNERTASFTIFEKGDRARFHCFGCGADGDAIGFVMQAEDLDFKAAIEHLAGLDPATSPRRAARAPVDDARERAKRTEDARRIWRIAKPVNRDNFPVFTALEHYFQHRGIDLEVIGGVPPSLRFAPALKHPPTGLELPAMVAAIQEPNGKIAGVHRTYLKRAGDGKAGVVDPKMMKGICWQGAVRFGPVTPVLAMGEGIETCLSIVQAFAEAGLVHSVWAALSLGNMGAAVIPETIRKLVLFADNDAKDTEKATEVIHKAAWRQERPGREVVIATPPPGTDFNDVLRAAGE